MNQAVVERPAPALPPHETVLADLIRFADLPKHEAWAATIFSNPHSVRWFVRQHGEALAARGVLLKLRGEWFARRSLISAAVAGVLGIDATGQVVTTDRVSA